MPNQHAAPKRIDFPPVLISLLTLVFIPIAPIAITIKNLDKTLSGSKIRNEKPNEATIVVSKEAKIK